MKQKIYQITLLQTDKLGTRYKSKLTYVTVGRTLAEFKREQRNRFVRNSLSGKYSQIKIVIVDVFKVGDFNDAYETDAPTFPSSL